MKLTAISTSATPWLASQCANTVTPVAGARSITAPHALGLTADGAAKLRQEKTARVQAALGSTIFTYGTTGMVTDHPAVFDGPVGDEQTTSTANGEVQGPPPWRQPVIT